MTKHKSNSLEQQEAEKYMLKSLEEKLGIKFDSDAVLPIDIGVKPDAIDPVNKVVVKVHDRVGAVKGGQLHKIKGDILRDCSKITLYFATCFLRKNA